MTRKPKLLDGRARGVTLIELIVVIALIGVMAAIGGPAVFRAVDRSNAKATAREIANAFRYARAQATTRGEPLWVSIDTGTGPNDRGTIRVARMWNAANPAPRSCREFNAADINFNNTCGEVANRSCVYELDINTLSGQQYLRVRDPGAGVFCFSPDGRVLTESGRPLPQGDLCAGESFAVYTSDFDTSLPGAATECITADVDERLNQRIDRQTVKMYKITVPFNGATKVEQ